MTLANLKIEHARLKWLASGEFTERDFDYEVKANDNPHGDKGEKGWSTMGDFSGNKRKELIIHKAKNALKEFGKKYDENYNPTKKAPVRVAEVPVKEEAKEVVKSQTKKK